MAGIKGRSGGPRKNAGGARPGAGRPKGSGKKSANLPPKVQGEDAKVPESEEKDPLQYLLKVMNDVGQDPRLRVRAAVAAVQYLHPKVGEGGKKDAKKAAAAKVAGASRFQSGAPPKLVVSNK